MKLGQRLQDWALGGGLCLLVAVAACDGAGQGSAGESATSEGPSSPTQGASSDGGSVDPGSTKGEPGPGQTGDDTASTAPAPDAELNNYLIGAGIYDITGEVAETALFGYATGSLRSAGLRDRQYARAFIMQEPGQPPAVFVSIDKGGMFQATNLALMDRLSKAFGGVYKDANVMVSATHTHVASGGMSHYGLYQIASGGYFSRNQEVAVDGIFKAIERAHNNLEPGRIMLSRGSLSDASVNRSKPAYRHNKDAGDFSEIDEDFTLLKFVNHKDKNVGMICWFAVHPTNFPNDWTHLSGDNKGYAAMQFEALMKADYGTKSFVAAFAQSNAGDMSPNLNQPAPTDFTTDASGPGETPEQSVEIIGSRQYKTARALFESEGTQLKGSIRALSRYQDFSRIEVDKAFTDGKRNHRTCMAALGASFAAGAEDGRSDVSSIFKEGMTKDPNTGSALDKCHAEKQIFLIPGINDSSPSTPKILPVSLFKIGQLGILAAPSEFTVMAGRRARATVESVGGTGITQTVFAGYADAYAGYVTTREEYAKQHYEGASTHFGPWTLGAFRQSYHRLAQSLADAKLDPWPSAEPKVPRGVSPQNSGVTVVADWPPIGKKFGDVAQDAKASYAKGELVRVEFWGGHPNNNLMLNDSYLRVQAKQRDGWVDIALDRDFSTQYTWRREGIGRSRIIIEWRIPSGVPTGTYRIQHRGHAKGLTLERYVGTSREFEVGN